MLSGESAAGNIRSKPCRPWPRSWRKRKKHIDYEPLFRAEAFQIKNMVDAISHATCCMACDIHAKAIVVSSLSGATVRMVSRFRVPVDIIGMATNERVWYRLALSWGRAAGSVRGNVYIDGCFVLQCAARGKEAMHLQPGDNVVVMTGGNTTGNVGQYESDQVETI